MNYQEAYKYVMESVTPGSVYGLERVSELAKRLGVPDSHSKIIHIAGTNGKGSTSRMLASVLKEAGYRVGIFNSPFLVSPTEYLCVNGVDATEQEYADVISDIRLTIDGWREEAKDSFEMPTEFELSVCAALLYFKMQQCDYIVLECGLGGLTDATNFIPAPEIAIITNIGLDHTGFLGDTVEKIAEQKAGIIKPGCEVVVYPSCNEAINVLAMKAIENKCRFHVADEDILDFDDIALFGEFQKRNAAVVVKAIQVINRINTEKTGANSCIITKENIKNGLKNVVWPGRFEIVRSNPYIIIDGGHNDQCIDALTESIDSLGIEKAIFVVGVMADKTHKDMFGKLAKYCKYVITTEPSNKRRLAADVSLSEWNDLGLVGEAICNPADAVTKALELAGNNDNIIICGSLYMVGDVRRVLSLK